MPFMAVSAADFVLKASVPSIIIVLPSGFFAMTEHLWSEALCAT